MANTKLVKRKRLVPSKAKKSHKQGRGSSGSAAGRGSSAARNNAVGVKHKKTRRLVNKNKSNLMNKNTLKRRKNKFQKYKTLKNKNKQSGGSSKSKLQKSNSSKYKSLKKKQHLGKYRTLKKNKIQVGGGPKEVLVDNIIKSIKGFTFEKRGQQIFGGKDFSLNIKNLVNHMGDQLVEKLNKVFVKLRDDYFFICFSFIHELLLNENIVNLSKDLENQFTAHKKPPNNSKNTIKIIYPAPTSVKNLYFDLSNGIGETNPNKLISIIIILILFYAVENINIYLLPYLHEIFNSKTDLSIEDLYQNIDRKAIFSMINNPSAGASGSSANASSKKIYRRFKSGFGRIFTKKKQDVDALTEDTRDKTLTSNTQGSSDSKITSTNKGIPQPHPEIEGQPELLDDCVDYKITQDNIQEKEQEYQKARNIDNKNAKDVAKKNYEKNRYINILPYNFNRVILEESLDNDYINASRIPDYHKIPDKDLNKPTRRENQIIKKENTKYIATQGPISNTITDFWRMIWQENVSIIVMLTGLVEKERTKCERYWPQNPLTTINYLGDNNLGYTVTNTEVTPNNGYQITKLTISSTNNLGITRTVYHCWFTAWPDHGVPDTTGPFIEFREAVNKLDNQLVEKSGPIVVHCSAGVGRTGTYIGYDALVNNFKGKNSEKNKKKINPVYILKWLRYYRVQSVQVKEQYVFLYQAAFKKCQEITNQLYFPYEKFKIFKENYNYVTFIDFIKKLRPSYEEPFYALMVFKNKTENAEIPYVFVMPFVDFTGNNNKLGTYYIHNVEKDGENLKMAKIYEHYNNELFGYKEDLLYTIHMNSKKPNIYKLLQFYFEFSKYFNKTLKHKIFQINPTQFDLDNYILLQKYFGKEDDQQLKQFFHNYNRTTAPDYLVKKFELINPKNQRTRITNLFLLRPGGENNELLTFSIYIPRVPVINFRITVEKSSKVFSTKINDKQVTTYSLNKLLLEIKKYLKISKLIGINKNNQIIKL